MIDPNRSRRRFLALSLLLLTPLMAGVLLNAAKPAAQEPGGDDLYKYLAIFSETLNLVRQNYVESTDLGTLLAGAMEGSTDALDPYSIFLPGSVRREEETEVVPGARHAGLLVLKDRGVAYAAAVEAGSVAATAGIEAGDIVSRVGGRPTRQMPLWAINHELAVALKGDNEDEIPALMEWAHGRGMDLSLIEVMPLGEVGTERVDQYLPLSLVRARLSTRYTIEDIDYRTGGPARYVSVKETGGRLGFITPLTHNFCESCNRVRLTCTGTLYMCLGQEDAADLRAPLRASESDEAVEAAIREAITRKPKGHDFVVDRRRSRPAVGRHMSVTGG